MEMIKFAAVIPIYGYAKKLPAVVTTLRQLELPVILVNDGSTPAVSKQISSVCSEHQCVLVEREVNGGKGAAICDGLKKASLDGYTHVFQVDADGQHALDDLPALLTLSRHNSDVLILGTPVYDDSVPTARKAGRWATHIWIWINTLSFSISDSMCGFRIYPLKSIIPIIESGRCGNRMDFDPEICVRASWANIPIMNFPVKVIYPEEGFSSFQLIRDNGLIAYMHTRLFFGMLIRSPRLIARKLKTLLQRHRNGAQDGSRG